MDISGHTFGPSVYAILEAIESSRFVCINLKLSGTPTAIQATNPVFGKPTLEQRFAEIKAAAETYPIFQFGLTCAKEDQNKKRYALSTYNFNLRPVPDRTLHVRPNIRLESIGSGISSLKLSEINYCYAKGIPYCSRDEVDNARTVEYGEAQNLQRHNEVPWDRSMFGLRGSLYKALEDFFYIMNEASFMAQWCSRLIYYAGRWSQKTESSKTGPEPWALLCARKQRLPKKTY